jgi:hypothetical protein
MIDRLCELPETFSPAVRRMLTAFLCLQALDIATTLVGLHLGANESSIFVARLLRFGPLSGLVLSKGLGIFLAITALRFNRERVIRFVNFWFAAVVGWNLVIIMSLPG